MKKIIFILVLASFIFIENTFAECVYDWDVVWNLQKCIWETDLYKVWNVEVESWLKEILLKWIKNIAIYLWIAAVFAIVFASAMLTLSAWDDEKINKAKGIFKWSVFWLLWVMFASVIITLIINVIYRLWEV